MSQIYYINLGDLRLPEFEAHRNINQDLIKEISESIKDIGIIEPLIVRKTKDGTEIVAGCVRYRAALLAGLKAVPCIFMSLDPQAAEVLKLHENIKRISLDHVDQGHTFLMMMEKFNMTEDAISKTSGKSKSYISQHISLVKINNELTRSVEDGSISFSQARELMRIDDREERLRLLSFCKNDGATVQVLQGWVHDYKRSLVPAPAAEPESPDQIYESNIPHISRFCNACHKSIELEKIRQVFYCPPCDIAIKSAISEEFQQKKQSSDIKPSP